MAHVNLLDLAPAPDESTAPAYPGVDEKAYWRRVLSQVGVDVAEPLTDAMNRIDGLIASGRIDRQGLRALRDAVLQAREVAMQGQRLSRYASGRLRQSHERLNLTQMLREALIARANETRTRGIQLRQILKPAEVIVDPSLLFGLLNAVLDWALPHARSLVTLRLDHQSWPAHARLTCTFAHRLADEVNQPRTPRHADHLDTLAWSLIQQIAATMALPLRRHDTESESSLTIEFPRTVNAEMEGVSAMEIDRGTASSFDAKPLAGSHVLVVAARREVRAPVRDALRHMGLIVDFVASVSDAREFCHGGLPHAIVYESALAGEQFDSLRGEIAANAPDFVFIEVEEEGDAFEVSSFSGRTTSRVGRDALATGLPSALVFELSKHL